VAAVVLAGEFELEFEAFEFAFDGVEIRPGALGDRLVAFFDGEFEEFGRIAGTALQPTPRLDAIAHCSQLLHHAPGGVGVVPETGVRGLFFEFFYLRLVPGEVKGAPACQRYAGRGRWHEKAGPAYDQRTGGERISAIEKTARFAGETRPR